MSFSVFNMSDPKIDPNMFRNSFGILLTIAFKLQEYEYSNDEISTFLEVMVKAPVKPDEKQRLLFESLVTYLHAQSKDFNDMLTKLHDLSDFEPSA